MIPTSMETDPATRIYKGFTYAVAAAAALLILFMLLR
jgi:hypothetical protein